MPTKNRADRADQGDVLRATPAPAMPSGFVTLAARGRRAPAANIRATRGHRGDDQHGHDDPAPRGDSGLPSGKRCGSTGSVKKYGGAKPHIGVPGGERAERPLAAAGRGVQAGEQVGADRGRDQHQPADRVAGPGRARSARRRSARPCRARTRPAPDPGSSARRRTRRAPAPPRSSVATAATAAREQHQAAVATSRSQRSSCPKKRPGMRGLVSLVSGTSGAAHVRGHHHHERSNEGDRP